VKDLHHEVELCVIIGKKGRDIPQDQAMDYVAGYTVALDMTARDLQDEAKTKGLPWSEPKGYDTFCALGSFVPKEKVPAINNLDLWLKVDGKMKQVRRSLSYPLSPFRAASTRPAANFKSVTVLIVRGDVLCD
jgi:acylpyruvate hydrolase